VSATRRSALVLLAAAVVVAVAALVAGGSEGEPRTLDERVNEIASGLRCPVCQNLSVADSPSALAREMRAEIAARLSAGASAKEVREFFVERYGEWVLLAPPRRGLNLLPWLVPVLGIGVGGVVWLALVRRRPAEELA
jgi:cytochrome c-type biogenesis protein CcmH